MKTISQIAAFAPSQSATAEYHILLSVTDPSLPYAAQLEEILHAYIQSTKGKMVHFRRFFLSDAANQAPSLTEALRSLPSVPTSVVQQAPLDGTRIAMWVYCTSGMDCPGGVPTHGGYSHHWTGSLVSPGKDSYEQMGGIFRALEGELGKVGLSVASDTVRTWIFVRDVDANYGGVVVGRREYFNTIGLTPSTHFIASTGIEGRNPDFRNIVEMDAYSVGGLEDGQKRYLYALDHLSPTADYGVTFERGTCIQYGDRSHIFISGTASIDSKGQVLYPGDVSSQTGRLLENVEALLREADAGLEDIAMAIVYLREAADYSIVRKVIEGTCPSLHALYVLGPVCRPAWLVEMECLALTPSGNPSFRAF